MDNTVTRIAFLSYSPSATLAETLEAQGHKLLNLGSPSSSSSVDCEICVFRPSSGEDLQIFLKSVSSNPLKPTLVAVLDEETPTTITVALYESPCILLNGLAVEAQLPLIAARVFHSRQCTRPKNSTRNKETAFEHMVATSPSMQKVFATIEKVSEFNTTVLIQGESGTGKELVARAIHSRSPRRDNPFVALNCGAIPENLMESELFGHRKGAFTDASKDKLGLLEEANGGTVLLDEIGELPAHLQVKLLRVLQEQCIHPLGAPEPVPIDVRVVAATLRNLETDVDDGRFRDDLFYRLNVVPITVPPLRERREDIDALIQHFIVLHRTKLGLQVYKISDEARQALCSYDWPGNVRELENSLERAMILCTGDTIEFENLPTHVRLHDANSGEEEILIDAKSDSLSIKTHRKNLEIHLITKALKETNGNRTHAAKLLDVSHRTLLNKLKEYDL